MNNTGAEPGLRHIQFAVFSKIICPPVKSHSAETFSASEISFQNTAAPLAALVFQVIPHPQSLFCNGEFRLISCLGHSRMRFLQAHALIQNTPITPRQKTASVLSLLPQFLL